MEKEIKYRVEVDEERKTLIDPETGKEWPVYFEQPEDFTVIERLVEQLNEECRKRLLPCVIRVTRAHRPGGGDSMVAAVIPGPRAPLSMHKLVREARGQNLGEAPGACLLAELKALLN